MCVRECQSIEGSIDDRHGIVVVHVERQTAKLEAFYSSLSLSGSRSIFNSSISKCDDLIFFLMLS